MCDILATVVATFGLSVRAESSTTGRARPALKLGNLTHTCYVISVVFLDCFISGMNPMISSRNYTPQQSLSGLFETSVRKEMFAGQKKMARLLSPSMACALCTQMKQLLASCINKTRAWQTCKRLSASSSQFFADANEQKNCIVS